MVYYIHRRQKWTGSIFLQTSISSRSLIVSECMLVIYHSSTAYFLHRVQFWFVNNLHDVFLVDASRHTLCDYLSTFDNKTISPIYVCILVKWINNEFSILQDDTQRQIRMPSICIASVFSVLPVQQAPYLQMLFVTTYVIGESLQRYCQHLDVTKNIYIRPYLYPVTPITKTHFPTRPDRSIIGYTRIVLHVESDNCHKIML